MADDVSASRVEPSEGGPGGAARIGEQPAAAVAPMPDDEPPTTDRLLESSCARDAASLSAVRCAAEAAEKVAMRPKCEAPPPAAAPAALDPTVAPETPLDPTVAEHLLVLPPELGGLIIGLLPLPCIARASCACRTLLSWGRRAVGTLTILRGSALSPPHDLAAGVGWLMRSGCRPRSASFGAEATDGALALLIDAPGSSLESLELHNCDDLSTLWFEPDAHAHRAGAPLLCAVVDVVDPEPASSSLTSLSIVRCAALAGSDELALPLARWIGSLHSLTHLSLEGLMSLPDKGLIEIVAGCPSLGTLCLNGCRNLSTDGVAALGRLRLLHTLDVGSCPAIASLTDVANGCTGLTSLTVSLCKSLGNKAVRECVEQLPRLSRLNLTGTSVSNEGLAAVASCCPQRKAFLLSNS